MSEYCIHFSFKLAQKLIHHQAIKNALAIIKNPKYHNIPQLLNPFLSLQSFTTNCISHLFLSLVSLSSAIRSLTIQIIDLQQQTICCWYSFFITLSLSPTPLSSTFITLQMLLSPYCANSLLQSCMVLYS